MSKPDSQEVLNLIHDGVTVTTLAQIFGMDHKEVNRRLVGKAGPVGGGKTVKYRIRDAAPWLIDLKVDPEEYLKALSPSKLPPALQDAFWKAQLSRQKYEENKGDLWRTERVYRVITEAFKVVRLTILMFNDNVSQQTDLSDRQQKIIQTMIDGLLESLNTALVEEFKDFKPEPDEHGQPLTADDLAIPLQPTNTEDSDDNVDEEWD